LLAARTLLAAEPHYARGDRLLAAYFRGETVRLAQRSSAAGVDVILRTAQPAD
jgi:hypothetical protein